MIDWSDPYKFGGLCDLDLLCRGIGKWKHNNYAESAVILKLLSKDQDEILQTVYVYFSYGLNGFVAVAGTTLLTLRNCVLFD